jgi:hypothetical protein
VRARLGSTKVCITAGERRQKRGRKASLMKLSATVKEAVANAEVKIS